MSLFGRPDIEKLKAKQDVRGLIRALGYKDDYVRRCAANALAKVGTLAVPSLIAALKDKNKDVQAGSAEALGKIRDVQAVEPLMAALTSADSWVQQAAARALGQIGDARAVEPLLMAIHDHDHYVRRYSAEALGKIRDPRAVESLIEALVKDQDKYVRGCSAEALGCIGDARAVGALSAALAGDDGWVQEAAVRAFEQQGWQPEGIAGADV